MRRSLTGARAVPYLACALAALIATGCDNMANQPKVNPYEVYRTSPEPLPPMQSPPSTVARDYAPAPPPPPVTLALLERGRQRFDIYCSPCHGFTGDGDGMIVQRGFPAPPSYHIDRLRRAPIQHFYDVITNGYGVMYSYAQRVAPEDRWAIIAYIRALQAAADVQASPRAAAASTPERADAASRISARARAEATGQPATEVEPAVLTLTPADRKALQ
jgi:mono/diheme cytochrome c family protein